ncbi:MAG: sulfur oxidation c-type cytochrome SoxX [Gammaproteobacteria bacterium]|nr:sulfur oxidation c-type cytochrome SoxX [Gammaproteobacteria bacterium]
MRKPASITLKVAAVAALLGGAILIPATASAADQGKTVSAVEQGKEIAFNKKLGNCLACHAIDHGTSPGDVGPPLVHMKHRFPDKQKLFQQVWDPRVRNPHTVMPPFGAYGILTKDQIQKIVDYLYTL